MEINLELFHPRFKGERIVARYDGSRVVPYFNREEIDGNGVLSGRGLEIAWQVLEGFSSSRGSSRGRR